MRGPHPQSHVTRWYQGHVTNNKRYISTFTSPLDSKLSRVVTWYDGIWPTKSRDTSATWSRGKLKTLYLHFHYTYRPQTLQGSCSGWGDLIYKVIWHINHVVTWQIKKRYISTFTRPMEPKGTPPTKSCDTWITWLGDKSKTFYLHIHKAHGPQNLVGCWLGMRGAQLRSHMVLQLCGQMENQKRHIFTTTGPSRCKKKACAHQK